MTSAGDTLNPEQLRAVEYDSGPLMVLAGPGTGKTRVITHRIAHLISARAVEPESIVALTYTVKASGELRDRLQTLVGPEADRVHAHTIHGLGLRIVQRFADVVGVRPPGLDGRVNIVDSAQQRRMLRSIILERSLFPGLRAQGVDAAVSYVIEVSGTLSNAGVSPAQAAEFCRRAPTWLDRMQDHRGQPLDQQGVDAERARVAMLEQSARAIELFGAACRDDGLLTFDDLISLPIRILSESKHAAAILRDEYRHIVVDEFQDANTAQIELLRVLMPPGADGRAQPDLCVVGDDDQSIYEFRGADDRAFHRFKFIWTTAERIDLQANFRSTPPIVAVANAIMARADTRFAPDKVVRPARASACAPPVECVHLEDDQQAGEVIAAMLLADKAANPEQKWSSYAVVTRSHLHAQRVHAALQIEGVPAIPSSAGTPLDDEGVREVLAWIELLADPHATHAAVRLLIRPPSSVDHGAALALASSYKARLTRFQTGDPGAADPGGFAVWLDALGPDQSSGAATFLRTHTELRAIAAQHSASDVIARIVGASDAAHADLPAARVRAERVAALVSLLRFARERQDRLDAPGDIRAFWSYWNDLSDKERGLGDDNPNDRVDGFEGGDADQSPDAVRLLTAHSSKGLEFDTVFVPNISPRSGYGAARDREGPELPAGLIRPDDERSSQERVKAEARRVFYVACTRAERRLVLLAKKNKSLSKSTHYFEEIREDSTLKNVVQVREGVDEIRRAGELGLGRGIGWRLDEHAPLDAAARGFKGISHRREVFEKARLDLRAAAAAALDRTSGPHDEPEAAIDQSASVLRHTAAGLAALALAESSGMAPAWADAQGVGDLVRAALARAGACERSDGSTAAGRGLTTPLKLSFTRVNDYLRCPACFYLKYVRQLEPPSGEQQVVGAVVHTTLQRFFTEHREAETGEDGRVPPGRDRLLSIGREQFFRLWPRHREADRTQLDQVLAQLALYFDRLHDPQANVLEIEKSVEFPYGSHRFIAKLDRVDQVTAPDGSARFRIVDFKTGRARSSLTNPKADDLQMGIYALALTHLYADGNDSPAALAGTAEYWLLSTGERGVIDLAAIDRAKVRKNIDKAVEGMLAGNWESGKDCDGDCRLFMPADAPKTDTRPKVSAAATHLWEESKA